MPNKADFPTGDKEPYTPEAIAGENSIPKNSLPAQAEDLLAIILSVPENYLLLVDIDLKLQLYSEAVAYIAKNSLGITLYKGIDVLELAHPSRKELVKSLYLSTLQGNYHETEVIFRTENGPLFAHNYFKPVRNSNDEIIGIIVNAVNVTERRTAELEILKTKNNLDLLLNNTNEIFVLIDKDFKILLMNRALSKNVNRYLGKKVMIGDDILEIDRGQNDGKNEERKQNILKAFNGETIASRFSIPDKKNNSLISFESLFKPAYNEDGIINAVILTVRDVTQVVKTRKLLVESEERWRFALEGSNMGMWDWNIKNGKVFYSDSYKKLYGYNDEDIDSLGEEWEKRVHPDDVALVENNLATHLKSPDPYFESIYRFHGKNGVFRWILARGMIISRNDDGTPARMIGTHMDITESKEKDESFRMLFYGHPLPMWTYDQDTLQFLEVNEAAITQYGFSRKEFLSMTIKDIRPAEDVEKMMATINLIKINRKQKYGELWRHKKKNGEIIFVNVKSQVLEKNNKLFSIASIIDVTEKVKAEAELLKSEKQYRFLFKSNPLASWIYEVATWKFLEVNDAAIKFYGYAREEFLTMDRSQIYVLEQRDLLKKNYEDEKKKDGIRPQQWKHVKRNGEIKIVNQRESSILYNGSAAMLVVIEDVTEKVKAEKELRDSNERFTLTVKAISDAIYDCDLRTGSIAWGDGMLKLFGHEPGEISFQSWDDHIHPEDRDKISNSLNNALSHPRKSYWKGEYRFLKKDNTFSIVLDRGYIVRNEEKVAIRIIGAMQDITDLKKKEKELEKSKERFDAVMTATNDLIWDWNLETGRFYRDNEGLQKVYGVKEAQTIQNIFHWLQRIHPEDQKNIQKVIDEILHTKKEKTFEVEYRFRRDDGTYSYVYDRGKLMCDANGKPERMIGAAQDITERKKLEQQLLQKELEKQKVISKATIETQEQERGEIGKELHDNVNQVLTTTKLYLELSQSNPELKDDLIAKSAKNVMFVIDEIRQLSRSLMNPSIGDLGLVDTIKDLIENINITRKIHIIMDHSEDVEMGLSDNIKLMIFRIIQEALNNAVKHAKATTVLLTLRNLKGHIQLNIFDDGIGFESQLIKKGAGLRNIQNRVYLANGALTINSAPGKGCKLIIDIPLRGTNRHK
ncbi:MAG: PAS domain S-box protein [Chitinophagaceae bacterium]